MIAVSAPCSDTIDGYPHFIRALDRHPADFANPADLFDFWAPERLGDADLDQAAGAAHFGTALVVAKKQHGGSPCLLAYIINSMRGREIGPIEVGFLEAFASKAAAGMMPDPMPAEMIDMAVALADGCLTHETLLAGEELGREMLGYRLPWLIAYQLAELIKGRLAGPSAGFIWTVSIAAMSGSAN